MMKANGGTGTANVASGNGGQIFLGAGSGSSVLAGNVNMSNALVEANAGQAETVATGDAGTILLSFAGNYTGNKAVLHSFSAGNGGGGNVTVTSTSGGDITLTDTASAFRNWSNGTGVVNVIANNITNNGTISSRAARVAHATPSPNANSGGSVNITAAGTLTNNGDINASAWSPSLEWISTNDESTGHGGNIKIIAGAMINNGSSGVEKAGRIYAHGGLNTQGATQGNGGNIDIDVTGAFSDNAFSKIDSRGNPVNASATNGDNRVSISAGNINVNGRVNASGFYANDPGGYVELITTSGDLNVNSGSLVSASGGIGDVFNNQGAGGQIVLNSANNMTIAGNVTAIGQAGLLGGNIDATAAGLLLVSGTGILDTSGSSTGSGYNVISINGNSLSILGALTASSSVGQGGTINASINGTASTSAFNIGNYDVSGTASGGIIHLTADTLTNDIALNDTQTQWILESATGDLNVNNTVRGYEIDLVSNGATSTIDVNSSLTTTGLAASSNGGNITITAADNVIVDSGINFGGSASGGSGGTLTVNAVGDITINGAINGEGIMNTTALTGNGGTVNMDTHGSFTMNETGTISVDSVMTSDVNTPNANGGFVDIRSVGGLTINTAASGVSISSRGASFSKNRRTGGNGGQLTLTSTSSFIDLNDASGTGNYFDTRGGDTGRFGVSGDGGNVRFNYNTTLLIEGEDTSPTGSFLRTGGATGNKGTPGTDADLLYNGAIQ